MERKRKIIAALADLKQEVAGTVPVDIVGAWQRVADRTVEAQAEVLRPYERKGYLVCTDSAGLSALTAEKSLLEVMKLVSEPKEIIYEFGRAIGGEGVGVWAADNSQMFYDAGKVGAEEVLLAMVAVQKQLASGVLQVGMGITAGTFWQLGQGIFGPSAEVMEEVAEDHTAGREIVVDSAFRRKLLGLWPDIWELKRESGVGGARKFYSVNYEEGALRGAVGIGNLGKLGGDDVYPLPFDKKFFGALHRLDGDTGALDELGHYFHNKVVVLIRVYHPGGRLLLDELTDWVVMNAVLTEIAAKYAVQLVKSNGMLGIYVVDSDTEAVEFAEDVLLNMRRAGDNVSIGLARGEVLLFDLDGGGREIAGGPVNVASKIAEDIVEKDTFYVDESVVIPAHHLTKFERYVMDRSRVTLCGWRYL